MKYYKGESMNDNLTLAVEQWINGDENGFNVIYNETYNYVFAKTRAIMKNYDDAADLLQEVYIAASRSLDTLKDVNNLYAWLGGIAYRQGMKIFNKQRDVLLSDEGEGLFEVQECLDKSVQPGVEMEERETANIIQGMLDELPPEQSAVVVAYYYDEMSVTDIANTLGVSTGTIKSRLNYARKKIEELVLAKEKAEGIRLHVVTVPSIIMAVRAYMESFVFGTSGAQAAYNIIAIKMGYAAVTTGQAIGAAGALATAGIAANSGGVTGAAAMTGTTAISGATGGVAGAFGASDASTMAGTAAATGVVKASSVTGAAMASGVAATGATAGSAAAGATVGATVLKTAAVALAIAVPTASGAGIATHEYHKYEERNNIAVEASADAETTAEILEDANDLVVNANNSDAGATTKTTKVDGSAEENAVDNADGNYEVSLDVIAAKKDEFQKKADSYCSKFMRKADLSGYTSKGYQMYHSYYDFNNDGVDELIIGGALDLDSSNESISGIENSESEISVTYASQTNGLVQTIEVWGIYLVDNNSLNPIKEFDNASSKLSKRCTGIYEHGYYISNDEDGYNASMYKIGASGKTTRDSDDDFEKYPNIDWRDDNGDVVYKSTLRKGYHLIATQPMGKIKYKNNALILNGKFGSSKANDYIKLKNKEYKLDDNCRIVTQHTHRDTPYDPLQESTIDQIGVVLDAEGLGVFLYIDENDKIYKIIVRS